jgi:3-hydroxyisobutyrate dehydrogenase-like beta-hydroxyacid dehydrogenase
MEVGVIGLGSMGFAMASHILAAGHDVTVYNRTEEKAHPLMEEGATFSHDPSGAAQGDVVITMLSDDHAVESVVFGKDGKGNSGEENGTDENDDYAGLIFHQSPNCVHVSMSTIGVHLVKRMESEYLVVGKPFISAPVMGRPDVAERGELVVMASGDKAMIEKCQPVFDAIGRVTHFVGDSPVQAAAIKLAANFMLSSMIETLGEAFALVRKNGADHHKFLEIMAKDFFKSPIYEKYGAIIANERFGGGAFTVRLQEKDTRLAVAAAIEAQVPMPVLFAVENAFLSAIGQGKGDMDPCAIAQLAAENAGLR